MIIFGNKIIEQYDELYKICILVCEAREERQKELQGIVKSAYYG
jgi:hypothetical protein